jgi:hypothetical protein
MDSQHLPRGSLGVKIGVGDGRGGEGGGESSRMRLDLLGLYFRSERGRL